MSHRQGFVSNTQWLIQESTLGARDFSSAVSGFCQVFIVTRRSWLRSSANTEYSRRTREKPLVPRVPGEGPALEVFLDQTEA